jgi:hypothetical protein
VSNGYFTLFGNQYTIPTAEELGYLSQAEYDLLLLRFKQYVLLNEPGLSFANDIVNEPEIYAPEECYQITTTTTTGAVLRVYNYRLEDNDNDISEQIATIGTISSFTYLAGYTYVLFISSGATVPPSDDPAISSGGLTFVKLGTILLGNKRIISYSVSPEANETIAVQFTYAETQSWFGFCLFSVQNTARTIYSNSNSGTGENPSIELPISYKSGAVAYFLNNNNPFNATIESPWGEFGDAGNDFSGVLGAYANNFRGRQ